MQRIKLHEYLEGKGLLKSEKQTNCLIFSRSKMYLSFDRPNSNPLDPELYIYVTHISICCGACASALPSLDSFAAGFWFTVAAKGMLIQVGPLYVLNLA